MSVLPHNNSRAILLSLLPSSYTKLIRSLLFHHNSTLLYTSQNVLQGIVCMQCSLGHYICEGVDQILERNHLQLFVNLILIPGLSNKSEFPFATVNVFCGF